jgi:hypothetical protein
MSIITAHLNLCAVRLKALSRQLAATGGLSVGGSWVGPELLLEGHMSMCKEYLAAGPVPLKFAMP